MARRFGRHSGVVAGVLILVVSSSRAPAQAATEQDTLAVRFYRFNAAEATPGNARNEAAEVFQAIRDLRATRQPWNCSFAGQPGFSCVDNEWGVLFFLAPFPATLPMPSDSLLMRDLPPGATTPSGDDLRRRAILQWVPVDSVKDGRNELRRWKELAERRRPIGCDSLICHLVVRAALSVDTTNSIPALEDSVSFLAFCDAQLVNAVLGAPTACRPIALTTGDATWVRAVTVLSTERSGAAEARGGDFSLVVADGLNPETVLNLAARVLGTEPFHLQVMRRSTFVRGRAGPRVSDLLRPHREEITVQVTVDKDPRNESAVAIDVFVTLWVSRRNPTGPGDLHQPTAMQAETYLAALRKQLQDNLARLCPSVSWRDASTIVCRTRSQ